MKRSRALFSIFCIIALSITVHLIAARQTSMADGQATDEARGVLDSLVTVHAAGRMNPFVNLRDGHGLPANFQGSAPAVAALRNNNALPLSLCATDFDEDGMPDLAAGYSSNGGG
ncbi:MAG TPA: hypothetical protein VIS78_13230, partial [Blastocatellia bacterium]